MVVEPGESRKGGGGEERPVPGRERALGYTMVVTKHVPFQTLPAWRRTRVSGIPVQPPFTCFNIRKKITCGFFLLAKRKMPLIA
jgi:hypothetical protein